MSNPSAISAKFGPATLAIKAPVSEEPTQKSKGASLPPNVGIPYGPMGFNPIFEKSGVFVSAVDKVAQAARFFPMQQRVIEMGEISSYKDFTLRCDSMSELPMVSEHYKTELKETAEYLSVLGPQERDKFFNHISVNRAIRAFRDDTEAGKNAEFVAPILSLEGVPENDRPAVLEKYNDLCKALQEASKIDGSVQQKELDRRLSNIIICSGNFSNLLNTLSIYSTETATLTETVKAMTKRFLFTEYNAFLNRANEVGPSDPKFLGFLMVASSYISKYDDIRDDTCSIPPQVTTVDAMKVQLSEEHTQLIKHKDDQKNDQKDSLDDRLKRDTIIDELTQSIKAKETLISLLEKAKAGVANVSQKLAKTCERLNPNDPRVGAIHDLINSAGGEDPNIDVVNRIKDMALLIAKMENLITSGDTRGAEIAGRELKTTVAKTKLELKEMLKTETDPKKRSELERLLKKIDKLDQKVDQLLVIIARMEEAQKSGVAQNNPEVFVKLQTLMNEALNAIQAEIKEIVAEMLKMEDEKRVTDAEIAKEKLAKEARAEKEQEALLTQQA